MYNIGDYVELHTEDSYDNVRGFIVKIQEGIITINCAKMSYDYYIRTEEAEEKITKII